VELVVTSIQTEAVGEMERMAEQALSPFLELFIKQLVAVAAAVVHHFLAALADLVAAERHAEPLVLEEVLILRQ
jgi:hypothetical protein